MKDVQSREHYTDPLPNIHKDLFEEKIRRCKIKFETNKDFQDTWGAEEDLLECQARKLEEDVGDYFVDGGEGQLSIEEEEVFDKDVPPHGNDGPLKNGSANNENKDKELSMQSFVGSFRNSLCFTY